MPNPVDHIEELRALADLLGSFELTFEQQATVLEHVRQLRADQVSTYDTGLGPAPGAHILPLREAERRHLLAALRYTNGKIYGRDGAAKLLDLKPTTLQSKLKKHGINRLDATGEDGPSQGSGSPPSTSDGSLGRAPSGAMQRAAE